MPPLWTGQAFAEAVGGTVHGDLPDGVTGVSIDGRTLERGDAFFAIEGLNHDGHDFVGQAFDHNAAIAVVRADFVDRFAEDRRPLVGVGDTLEAMRRLGRAARRRSSARVIGITGSVGKTGTKEALATVLAPSGETHAAEKSYNNHWGVPLTLARLPETATYGVFEMGMNAAGEITPLTQMVRPHIAIITTVEPVHIEFFESLDGIAEAKAEILLGLEPEGTAILNRDNPYFAFLAERAETVGASVVGFGKDEDADARLVDVALHEDATSVTADILGERMTYRIGAPGAHHALNSLAVMATVKLAGADLARAALAYREVGAPVGRGQRTVLSMRGGTLTLIDESYNANPASMRAALAVLGQTPVTRPGRRIAVLGDMRELGDRAEEMHRDLADVAAEAGVDVVFTVGDLMRHLSSALASDRRGLHADKAGDLLDVLIEDVRPGDVVMVKGSLATGMGGLVSALKTHYPPVQTAGQGESA